MSLIEQAAKRLEELRRAGAELSRSSTATREEYRARATSHRRRKPSFAQWMRGQRNPC